ncbi:MAG: TonB-dependent receptor [Spirochaetales bacterium]|nr:TonB-dependent receptor [Spirochaetales bacterium]
MKKELAGAVLILLAATALSAENETDRIVISGNKTVQNAEDTVEAVEVIDEEEIKEMGARNVEEVLEGVLGITIYDHPQSTVMLQGFEGEYVKVLVDGIEITGDIGGATPIAQIPVTDIERIEIVRGASSVLYGSDAMGGVINIITHTPEVSKKGENPLKLNFSLFQEVSSNSRLYGGISGSVKATHLYADLTASYDYDDGLYETEENTLGNMVDLYDVAAYRLGYGKSRIGWRGDRGDISLFATYMNRFQETSLSSEAGISYDDSRVELGLDGSLSLNDTSDMSGFLTWKTYDHDVTDIYYNYDTEEEETSAYEDVEGEWRYLKEVGLSHQILTGFNGRYESLGGDSFEGDTYEAKYVSWYLQDTWNKDSMDILRVVPGIRLDVCPPSYDDEDLLYKVTPKVSLRWDPASDWVYRVSYGMGYKVPTLKQKYWRFFHVSPYNFMLVGNPNLVPETSHGLNTSVEYGQARGWSFTGSAYFNYLFDMITTVISDDESGTWTSDDGTTTDYIYIRTYENKDEAITAGVDVSAQYAKGGWKGSIGYSWGLAKYNDDDTDGFEDLSGRSPHQVKGDVTYTLPDWKTKARLSAQWLAPELIDEDDGGYSPDYFMVDLRLEQPFLKDRLSLYGEVGNLLNNYHFIEGTEEGEESQEDYYGLYDGMIFTLGARYTY